MTFHSDRDAVQLGRQLNGLDGLRGLAALAVFGVHYNQIVDIYVVIGPIDFYRLFANGEYGVALFFILSGLLLSQPFWKSAIYDAEQPDLKTYFIRRLARIFPAYYLSLTLLILVTGYWRYPEAWPDILLHYSFLFNYAEFSIFSINAPFWTLAVEVQFYCLLPLLFLLFRRLSPRNIIIILLGLCVTVYGLHYGLVSSINKIILWPGSSSLTWIRPYGAVVTHSLVAHLPHFMLGVIAGRFLLELKTETPMLITVGSIRYDVIFWGVLSLLFVILSTEFGNWIQIPYGRYGLPIIPILLCILIFSTPLSRGIRKILESYPLRILGTLSYGVYIYHLPILTYIDQAMSKSAIDAREHWAYLGIISLSFTLLAATISYLAVERPILKLAHRIKS